eukprot:gene18964-22500_t
MPGSDIQLVQLLSILLISVVLQGGAFIYKPKQGQIWDPSLMYWNKSYYAVSMYSPKSNKQYPSGFLSKSNDG